MHAPGNPKGAAGDPNEQPEDLNSMW